MPSPIRRRTLCLALAAALATPALLAQDAAYPTRPIRFIFPWAPGSTIDSLVRSLAEGMAQRLKQPVVVDTRSGANGIIAARALIDAPADGYTIMVGNEGSFGINSARPNPPYDARRDFTPVTQLATSPLFLVVNTQSKYQTLKQMVDYAKAHPGAITYGTIGVGSSSHLIIEKIALANGISMVHVPYKGSPETINSVQAGHTDFAYTGGLGNVQNGRVRAIAVSTGQRYPGAPQIPTVKEQLAIDYDEAAWFGIVAPKGLPAPILEKLHAAITDTLADPKMREKYGALGFDIATTSSAELGIKIGKSVDTSSTVIRQAKIEIN